MALLDAGLTCSASLPCPAEMGASIHIKGTGSSIIDTVLVCRTTGSFPKRWLVDSGKDAAILVEVDIDQLRAGNVDPTPGDIRCIAFKHLIRLAIWNLRKSWDKGATTAVRIAKVGIWLQQFGQWPEVEKYLSSKIGDSDNAPLFDVCESTRKYGGRNAEISF